MRTTAKITNGLHRQILSEVICANYARNNLEDIRAVITKMSGKKCFKVDGAMTAVFKNELKSVMPQYNKETGYPTLDTSSCLQPLLHDDIIVARHHHTSLNLQYKSLYLKVSVAVTFGTTISHIEEHTSDDFIYFDYDLFIANLVNDNELELKDDTPSRAKVATSLALNYDTIKEHRANIEALKKQIDEHNKHLPYYARVR